MDNSVWLSHGHFHPGISTTKNITSYWKTLFHFLKSILLLLYVKNDFLKYNLYFCLKNGIEEIIFKRKVLDDRTYSWANLKNIRVSKSRTYNIFAHLFCETTRRCTLLVRNRLFLLVAIHYSKYFHSYRCNKLGTSCEYRAQWKGHPSSYTISFRRTWKSDVLQIGSPLSRGTCERTPFGLSVSGS